MKNQGRLDPSLFLTVVISKLMIGLAPLQTVGIHAQNDVTPVLDQTANHTGNTSLSAAMSGQQGGTPQR
jgi:hypothetical protein